MNSGIEITDADTLKETIEQGRDFLLSHGVMLRSADGRLDYHAPFTLFPSPVPAECFDTAIKAQTVFNLLMHRVAHDHQFLQQCLERTIEVDAFTGKLWEIYLKAKEDGKKQTISLGMNRSDYMSCSQLDGNNKETLSIKQVEFNTMASGAGSLSQRLCNWHKYALGLVGQPEKATQIADNRASDGLADAVVKAWGLYGKPESVVLFLILSHETNIYDQRLLEYSIRERDVKCRVVRRTLQDIQERAKLGSCNELIIDNLEVAVLYQRSGYNPDHFRGEQDWDARLMIERSNAIKCPTLHYHLAGTKKVQQVLADRQVLQRYLDKEEDIDLVLSTQTGLYSLNMDEDGDRNIEMGIQNPDRFVLKPQREGGGNNIFGEEIAEKLTSIRNSNERTAFILMDRIRPLRFYNYIVKHGQEVQRQELISEIGIFGSFIGSADEVLHNAVHGYLFRSKTVDTNEGGLMSGTAALDSIFLV